MPDATPPSFWIEGGAALLARQGSVRARSTKYAIVVVLVVVGIIDWKMTLAMMFYGAIFTAVWAAWKMLAR